MKSTGLVFKSRDYIGSAEPPATVLEDESRYGNDGAFLGDGQPDWIQLPSGLWVMDFDGTDDNVSLGATTFDALTSATIQFWYRPTIVMDDYGNHRMLFGSYKDADNYFQCYYAHHVDAIRFYSHYVGGDPTLTAVGGKTINTWYNYTIVFGAGGMELFINSVSQDTDADTVCFADMAPSAFNYLGKSGASEHEFEGDMVGLRIYNHALNQAQIGARYQAERHWFGV